MYIEAIRGGGPPKGKKRLVLPKIKRGQNGTVVLGQPPK